ncbi:MAG: hypothetical protein NVSMB56_01580 [Pyrinomonadaceae bacterium]
MTTKRMSQSVTRVQTSNIERQRLAFKLDALIDSEVREVLEYITVLESMRRTTARPAACEDELIALLADTPENKRARQAFEWEAARRRAERHTGTTQAQGVRLKA